MVANGRDAERVAAREEGWGAMCDVIERRADLCGGWRRVRARARTCRYRHVGWGFYLWAGNELD